MNGSYRAVIVSPSPDVFCMCKQPHSIHYPDLTLLILSRVHV